MGQVASESRRIAPGGIARGFDPLLLLLASLDGRHGCCLDAVQQRVRIRSVGMRGDARGADEGDSSYQDAAQHPAALHVRSVASNVTATRPWRAAMRR
ncbi:hypothetical protein B5P19_08975 [Clavibacter sepedonicus]|nr:hypothetical protein B5P19_08975 [Clavibacter sepedonicus]OQJ53864.1 hypothetical protein B5P20_06815 [Clavibacter sepedonicus]